MTRKEAIKLIEHISIAFVPTDQYGDYDDPQPYEEALDMAIEALQAQPTHGRLIDADALSKKLCETTIFIKDGEVFQRMINDAPTVPVVDITQRDLCQDISCEDCPFMQETCKLMDYVAYADRPHGEWVECLAYYPDLDEDVLYIECDQCGHRPYFSGSYRPKYCEECGARMYKGGENK